MEQDISQNTAQIVGAWKLISFEIRRDDGQVMHPDRPQIAAANRSDHLSA